MSFCSIHGPKSASASTADAIFGMKTSVISLIWVSAWNTATTSPATRPKSSTGPARRSVISSAFRPSWRTNSGLMCASVEALDERAHEQVPAVDEHEDHELEREGDEDRR